MQRWMNEMRLIGRQPVTSQSHPTLPSAEIPSHDGIRRVELELAPQPAYVCFAMSHPYCTWGRVIPVTPILSRREMCCADADGKAIIHKKGGWHVFINAGPGRPWLAASLVGRQVVAPTINRPYRHRRFS